MRSTIKPAISWPKLVLGLLLLMSVAASAHEVRPAFLELTETKAGYFQVLWKLPANNTAIPAIEPRLPSQCREQAQRQTMMLAGAMVARWRVDCGSQGLNQGKLRFQGLAMTLMDVLVRIESLDGHSTQNLVKPQNPVLSLAEAESEFGVVSYLTLGVEHILQGIDHLLFVFCLLLIVRQRWLLVKTITAFTLAHSITLALAVLEIIQLPAQAVEATIALSIVFLAGEVLRAARGDQSLALRKPWLVAFAFGLLHGLGFAGALAEIGLPAGEIPMALLFFNLGVEAGQLLFVTAVLLSWYGCGLLYRSIESRLTQPIAMPVIPRANRLAAYCVGSVAAFWTLERAAPLISVTV